MAAHYIISDRSDTMLCEYAYRSVLALALKKTKYATILTRVTPMMHLGLVALVII